MTRRPKTYAALSEMLGAVRCGDCDVRDHHYGEVDEFDIIHWTERVMRWEGLVRYLKLVAISRDQTVRDDPVAWRRVYLLNMALKEVAKDAHARIPGRLLRADKAFVRAAVANINPNEPYRQEAYEWSRREAGQTWI